MTTMTLISDCLNEFAIQFESDPLVDWGPWLARAETDDLRRELAREFLVCGAEMANWDFVWIADRFVHASHIWDLDSDRIGVLRFLAGFQLRYGPSVKWSDYSRFGTTPEALDIRLRGEPFCLGMNLEGRYSLDERIAHGGFGVVYRATETATEQTYAVKLPSQRNLGHSVNASVEKAAKCVDSDGPSLESASGMALHTEATLLKAFAGQGLPSYHDFLTVNEWPVLVMEHIDGESLRELVAEHRISHETAVHVLSQVADILAHLHEFGYAHLDLSPNNILVGKNGRAYLIDLGTMETEAEIIEPLVSNKGGTPGFSVFASANAFDPLDRLALDWDSYIRVTDHVRTTMPDDRSNPEHPRVVAPDKSSREARDRYLTRVLRRDEFHCLQKDSIMWPRGLPGRLQAHLGIGSRSALPVDDGHLPFAGWVCGRLVRHLRSFLRGEDLPNAAYGRHCVAAEVAFVYAPSCFEKQFLRNVALRERVARRFGDLEDSEIAFRTRCHDVLSEIQDSGAWLRLLLPHDAPLQLELLRASHRSLSACIAMGQRPVLEAAESGQCIISVDEGDAVHAEDMLDWDLRLRQAGGNPEEVVDSVVSLLEVVHGVMANAPIQAKAIASLTALLEERATMSIASVVDEIPPLLDDSGMPGHTWKSLVDDIVHSRSQAAEQKALALLVCRFKRYVFYGSVDVLFTEFQ